MSCKSLCIWPVLSAFDRQVHESARAFAVFSRGENAIIITEDNKVYAVGKNGDHGVLGIGGSSGVLSATLVRALNGKRIISLLSSGVDDVRVVALTSDFKLFSWGSNRSDALGFKFTQNAALSPMPVSPQVMFVKVAIGHNHTMAITYERKVYSWGCNKYGQLGTGSDTSSATPVLSGAFKYDDMVDALDSVIDVACGRKNSYFITSTKKIYSVGCSNHGALGVFNDVLEASSEGNDDGFEQMLDTICGVTSSSNNCFLVQVNVNNNRINKIFAGKSTVYAVTVDNETYGWGRNDLYQLGGYDRRDQPIPVKIGNYHDIATHCDSHLVGGNEDGTIYVWGESRFGVIGGRIATCLKRTDDIFVVYQNSHTHQLVNISGGYTIPPAPPTAPPTDDTIIIIHPGSCDNEGFPISWTYLEHNSAFFKVLIKQGMITKDVKDYVIVGFDKNIIQIYVEYLKTLKINSEHKKYLKEVIYFGLMYREWNMIQYIIQAFGIYPDSPDEQLTIDNVCFVYEKALGANNGVIQKYCIEFIRLNMMAVFISDPFLTGINSTTMQSIMQALAKLHYGIFSQIEKTRNGHDGEGIIREYPDILVKPHKKDLFQMIYEISNDRTTDPFIDIMNHVDSRMKIQVSETPVIYKCMTLPQPAMQHCCF